MYKYETYYIHGVWDLSYFQAGEQQDTKIESKEKFQVCPCHGGEKQTSDTLDYNNITTVFIFIYVWKFCIILQELNARTT